MDLNKLRRLAGINTIGPKSITPGNSQANQMRRLAGLPMLPESKEEGQPPEETEQTTSELPPEEGAEVEDQPAIIKKIASHLEGKSVEEIEAMLMKVYDAGKADALQSTEEAPAEETPSEETPSEETPSEETPSEEIGLEPGEE